MTTEYAFSGKYENNQVGAPDGADLYRTLLSPLCLLFLVLAYSVMSPCQESIAHGKLKFLEEELLSRMNLESGLREK
jgi:hypothetical protein